MDKIEPSIDENVSSARQAKARREPDARYAENRALFGRVATST